MRSERIRQGLLYVLPFAASTLLPFLTLPIMTRYLAPEDYGVFALAQVYAGFLAGVANFCLPAGYERNTFGCTTIGEKAGLLYSVQATVLALFVPVTLASVFFLPTLSRWITGSPGNEQLMLVCLGAAAATSLKSYFIVHLRNEGRAGSVVRWTLAETVLATGATLYLVVGTGMGAMGLALGQLFANALLLGLQAVATIRELPLRFDFRLLRETIQVSLPLTPSLLFKYVWMNIDKFILGVLRDAASVGIYSIGQRIGGSVFGLMSTLDGVLIPYVYKHLFAGKDLSELGRGLTPFAYVSIVPSLLAVLLAQELITLLLPAHFHGAVEVSIFIALFYGFSFIGKITGVQIIFCKRAGINLVLNLLNMAALVGLCNLLAVRHGALGAALAFFLAGLLYRYAGLVFAQRLCPIPYERSRLLAFHAHLLLTGGCVLWLRLASAPYWAVLGVKAGLLAAYLALGVWSRVLSPANLADFWQAVRSLPGKAAQAPESSPGSPA